ncbi:MAG: PKD domain-containing protein, partial [Bacteroidales bacterium]|nr:PKD domain-containing protein [Bacteroidales bacterium]
MKTTKLIFSILVFVFATSFTFAQDDVYSTSENKQSKEKKEKDEKEKLSKRKINTGYVFIDGKYVEPPYKVKRRGMAICINDIPITKSPELKKKRDYLIVKKDPGIPPDIQKMDSINAIYIAKIKPYDISYIEAKLAYLYRNFSEDEAVKLTKKYLESMPNIKSVIGTKICEVEAFNGEKRKMILTTNSFDYFHNSERNELRLSKKNKKIILNEIIMRYEKRLRNGDVFFIFSDSTIYCDYIEVSYPEDYGICFMHELSDIICNSDLSYYEKVELIKQKAKNNLINKYIPVLISNFKFPKKIEETKDNNTETGSNSNKFQKDTLLEHYKYAEVSFSPNSNKIHIASPDPWSNRFSDYLTFNQRINQIVDLVKDQGYEHYPEFVSYIDYTNGDNLWEDLTFDNFKDFANGGINYWNSHGSMDELDNQGIEMEGFIIICYYNTPELINVFFPDEIPIEFEEYTYANPHENGWNGSNPPSIIAAYPEAATTFWKPSIDANNPIIILEACYSYQNGFVEACGEGGAVFGYQSESHYQPATANYNNLFKRLNGQIGSYDNCYRNTKLAFDDFIPSDGFQMHPPNANITLCPATQSYFPTNNSTVPPAVNSGEFVIDTWCNASIPASDALSLVFTDGDLSYNPATDVYWDNPVDGRSNKIIYKWSGTHGTVRVNINTNSIIAYGGGGQQLDFDRKTPNGEANAYYVFSVGYSNSNVVDFIASQYEILENTSIQFTNQSTVYNPISYFWDFGDGATSTQENPSHTYTNQGIYDVTLRINTPENEFYETKNALITVLTECSGNLYASYEFITDKKVNFHASYTGAYEPLVNEYRFTIYFGDGTYQSEQGILNMENFEKTYSDFGDYYPVVVVETIDQFGDIICLKEFEIGLLQISNPDPCSDFEVDFTISPPIAYNGIYGNSDVTVNFYNTTTGAS